MSDLSNIIGFLTTFKRGGDNRRWEEFRVKIPDPLLKLWGDLLIECRRNGFIDPIIENGKIVWHQVTDNGHERNGDLCTMCYRDCRLRDSINTGNMKYVKFMNKNNSAWREPKPCWKG